MRDSSLNNTLFSVNPSELAKPMQSFDGSKKTKKIDGKDMTFIQVQFPNQPSGKNSGWVAQDDIQPKSQCQYTANQKPDTGGQTQASNIKGLSDSACCTFPVNARPTTSYKEGMRRFRATRSGRLHAACDLYRNNGENVVAVAPGTVIRQKYYFYQGVYALEVRHSGGFVVRYGEVLGKSPSGTSEGDKVNPGQTVGYVGTVDSGCCSPMLHFELYSGNKNGPLTQRGANEFQRRSDLLNPTDYLSNWEQKKSRNVVLRMGK